MNKNTIDKYKNGRNYEKKKHRTTDKYFCFLLEDKVVCL